MPEGGVVTVVLEDVRAGMAAVEGVVTRAAHRRSRCAWRNAKGAWARLRSERI
jgi:hypothetical protein